MSLLRVVLDTNVWISGVFWRGTPCHILRAWRNEQFEPVYTSETLAEIESRLRRKAIEFGADLSDVRDWLAYIRTFARIVAASGAVMFAVIPKMTFFSMLLSLAVRRIWWRATVTCLSSANINQVYWSRGFSRFNFRLKP